MLCYSNRGTENSDVGALSGGGMSLIILSEDIDYYKLAAAVDRNIGGKYMVTHNHCFQSPRG